MHGVLRPLPRQHADGGRRPRRAEDFEAWKANQLEAYSAPEEGTLAATGEQTFIAQCSRCHQVDGLLDADGNPVISRPELYVWSEAAPNLTNLMTRNTFAGATFNLLLDGECIDNVWDAPPEEFGERYLEGVSLGVPQRGASCGSGCATRRR